jgi:protein-tyrosine phosphatase
MQCLVRCIVSEERFRYNIDGYDLDLTYITDTIIAMGFPASGVRRLWRNSRVTVKRFLDEKHPQRYRVYNLCAESQHIYPPSDFAGHHVHIPILDHSVSTLGQLLFFVADALSWLSKDPLNVIAAHCKAGKGRTGTLVSALLVARHGLSADEAIAEFGSKRQLNGDAVVIRSQIAWVRMFEHMFRSLSGNISPSVAASYSDPSNYPAGAVKILFTGRVAHEISVIYIAPRSSEPQELEMVRMGQELYSLNTHWASEDFAVVFKVGKESKCRAWFTLQDQRKVFLQGYGSAWMRPPDEIDWFWNSTHDQDLTVYVVSSR